MGTTGIVAVVLILGGDFLLVDEDGSADFHGIDEGLFDAGRLLFHCFADNIAVSGALEGLEAGDKGGSHDVRWRASGGFGGFDGKEVVGECNRGLWVCFQIFVLAPVRCEEAQGANCCLAEVAGVFCGSDLVL